MKTTEVQKFVKETIVNQLGIADAGTAIGGYKFAIPVETPEDGTVYATVAITCTKWKGTEKTEAFDLDAAVAAYEDKVAEAAAKAAERAAEREAKKAAKAAKAEG